MPVAVGLEREQLITEDIDPFVPIELRHPTIADEFDEDTLAEQGRDTPTEAGIPYGGIAAAAFRAAQKKERSHIQYNGYKIYQPTYGMSPNRIGWKRFLKKLLNGRPLKRNSSVKKSALAIVELNGRNSIKSLIGLIKSHGNKFDYVAELTKMMSKYYGKKDYNTPLRATGDTTIINITNEF